MYMVQLGWGGDTPVAMGDTKECRCRIVTETTTQGQTRCTACNKNLWKLQEIPGTGTPPTGEI